MGFTLPLMVNLTVAVAVAFGAGVLASWLRLSPIIGYLAAGIVVGPFTPGFVADRELIAALADVGVVLLMFALGIAFSLRDLARVGGPAIVGSLLQVAFTILGGWLIASALGWETFEGVFFGAILAASSSMVILKTLLDRSEIGASHGRLLLSMSIVQDLQVVVLVAVLPQFATLGSGSAAEVIGPVLLKVGLALAFIACGAWIGLRYLPRLMDYVAQLEVPELFTALVALIAFGVAGLSAGLGLSVAMGAFMAGLMLSESEYDKRLTIEIVPFRDLTTMIFFVFIGMMVDVRMMAGHWQAILGMAALVMVLKPLATLVALLPFRLDARTAAYTSLGMLPVGELNYLVAKTGLAANAITHTTYNIVLGASILSILLTPAAFAAAAPTGRLLDAIPGLRGLFGRATVPGTTGGRLKSDAVVIGYGRVGESVASGLAELGMSVTVVDHRLELIRNAEAAGLVGVYGEGSSRIVLESANVATARLVVVALPDVASTREAVRLARELNPQASVVARARNEHNVQELLGAGANRVMVPELAGAKALLNASVDSLSIPH